jgi:hypothetical protein
MIWTDCFKLIKVVPGRIMTQRFGTVDFSDPGLPVEKCLALFEDDFPYLEVTPLGKDVLYPVPVLAKLLPKEMGGLVRKMRGRKA